MGKREKVRQIYNKFGIIVGEDIIDSVLNNKKRYKNMMKLYKREKLESMNYILGKSQENEYFTQFELELLSKIDLFNRKVVEICKNIYEKEYKEANV